MFILEARSAKIEVRQHEQLRAVIRRLHGYQYQALTQAMLIAGGEAAGREHGGVYADDSYAAQPYDEPYYQGDYAGGTVYADVAPPPPRAAPPRPARRRGHGSPPRASARASHPRGDQQARSAPLLSGRRPHPRARRHR